MRDGSEFVPDEVNHVAARAREVERAGTLARRVDRVVVGCRRLPAQNGQREPDGPGEETTRMEGHPHAGHHRKAPGK